MKSMIPETSSGINWRDHVRDVFSNWHQHIHPSWAGVQDSFLLCLPLTPGMHSRVLIPSPTHHRSLLLSWKGKNCVISLASVSRGELLLNFHSLPVCRETFEPFIPLSSFWLFISRRSFHLSSPSPSSHILQKHSFSQLGVCTLQGPRLSGGGVHRQE